MPDTGSPEFASSTALMVVGEDLRIRSWNDAAERLTGVPAGAAVGRACWEVISGRADDGAVVCHPGCARARALREGRCTPPTSLNAATRGGRTRIAIETVVAHAGGETVFVHMLRSDPSVAQRPHPSGPAPRLTPRQREVLGLLAEGFAPKVVAGKLGLSEATVRNHIRLVLLACRAHSQLEALARARAYELV